MSLLKINHAQKDGFTFQHIKTANDLEDAAIIYEEGINNSYMTMSDIKERLDEKLEWPKNNRDDFKKEYENHKNEVNYIVIKQNNIDLGLMVVDVNQYKKYAELYDIIIGSDFRGHGIGEKALAWLEEELKLNGIKRILLESGVNNHQAHKLFEKNGFKKLAVEFIKEIE